MDKIHGFDYPRIFFIPWIKRLFGIANNGNCLSDITCLVKKTKNSCIAKVLEVLNMTLKYLFVQ